MTVIRGCDFPDDLWFDVEQDVWVRLDDRGEATLGMTDPAQTRCGKLVAVRFKSVGRTVARGRSLATIESAKWVGPFPSPLSGEIVATNAATFERDILAANRDPYGTGWLVRIRPQRLAEERSALLPADAAVPLFERRIHELQLSCLRCVDVPAAGEEAVA